jgi:RNA polymerase sigma-70 factor, ECF subfamily
VNRSANNSLAARLIARDPQAMAELYDLCGRTIFHIALRATGDEGIAEDLTQETFLRIWNRIPTFDVTRGPLTTWINAVARNTAIDYLRTPGARHARCSVQLKETHATCNTEEHFHRRRMVSRAIADLTASQRLILALSYANGMSHTEIAARLNKPLGTVKTWARTAMRAMAADISPTGL